MERKVLVFSVLILMSLTLIIYGCGTTTKNGGPSVSTPKIVYVLDYSPGHWDLFIMNVDGSSSERLTGNGSIGAASSPSINTWDPSVSHDGKKLAFISIRAGTEESLYVQNFDGTGYAKLTDSPSSERFPTWSADGDWIAFARLYDDGSEKILKVRSDGSGNETMLVDTHSITHDEKPDWSHDGSKIAFISDRDSPGTREIYTMNQDGSSQALFFGSPDAWSIDYPKWSPDGTKIVFQVQASLEGSSNRNSNLFIIQTSPPYTLTQITTSDYPIDNVNPEWSADGSKIIFASDRIVNHTYQIYLINADGSDVQELTSAETCDHPVWKP